MTTPTAPGKDQSVVGWRFENTYARLPTIFYSAAEPARVPSPQVTILNHGLAAQLGLDLHSLAPAAAAALFSGQSLPRGSQPIAQAYAGHQFGGFTMLGDGRAILLGEHRTPDGQLVDVQFKGSGQTRYSRRGDGRAALGPMLREYLISEAMAALGIPTTRSLAVVTTGEPVYRSSVLRGAVLTRVAASHLRVGTFQYFAARQDLENLKVLADYAIDRHDPDLAESPEKYLGLLRAVADRQASLIARWQHVGFIHGVMNTDNMAISGETIDYGPCAFMNIYHPDTVYSSIDSAGRYAYGNQPAIAQWNLARFAETLLPLLDPDQQAAIDQATAVLNEFPGQFERYWLAGMRAKLGLATSEPEDSELIGALLEWMQNAEADFTNTFRDLATGQARDPQNYSAPEFQTWLSRWQTRLEREGRPSDAVQSQMLATNPAVIPRNHRVEEALAAAENQDDLTLFHRLLDVLAAPYEPRPGLEPYQEVPPDDDTYCTFCGT